MSFISGYLYDSMLAISRLDYEQIERCIFRLGQVRGQGGRVFVVGCGGSAANASHLVNDLRKICHIEAYCATDNVAELTARTNDEGWESVFENWLHGCNMKKHDMLFVLSVGGGSLEKNVSPNIVRAVQYAKNIDATIIGIVGRDGGFTFANATACVLIPTVSESHTTPHAEELQAVVWHLFVSHPDLKIEQTKWESTNDTSSNRNEAAT